MEHGRSNSAVWVLDTSAIIEIKDIYDFDPLAIVKAFDHLKGLVSAGIVTFHDKTCEELDRRAGKADLPAVWAKECAPLRSLPLPTFSHIRVVMREVSTVVNVNRARDDADPWIVAYALELRDSGYPAVMVSEDKTDAPMDTSIRTTCRKLGIPVIDTGWFLSDCGAPPPY